MSEQLNTVLRLARQAGFKFHSGFESKEVMRITRDGIWVDPDISVDEAATTVLAALDENIKYLLQHERERCAKVCETYADKALEKHHEDWTKTAAICAALIRGMK